MEYSSLLYTILLLFYFEFFPGPPISGLALSDSICFPLENLSHLLGPKNIVLCDNIVFHRSHSGLRLLGPEVLHQQMFLIENFQILEEEISLRFGAWSLVSSMGDHLIELLTSN